ncbi:hypothetical protein BV898_08972 [Hypsibius exemplaris]|uniref:Uncharacterized protein n=1 Tax=Hypsibius exemplaris TaxID=2072580 RepID=A0A1W0WP92_HYPEX|nr:hypothetical protein BV898_08972 [Hypsibius exemplaris]
MASLGKIAALAALQRCSAVPNFVHIFNVLHADYLALPRLDIDEYEYSLLPPDLKDPDDVHDATVLPAIVIKLLKGCGQAYVRDDTCFDILRSVTMRKWHLYANPHLPCPFVTAVEAAAVETVPEHKDDGGGNGGQVSNQSADCTMMEVCEQPELIDSMATKEPAGTAVVREQTLGIMIEHGIDNAVIDTAAAEPASPVPVLHFQVLTPALKAEIMLVLLNSWMMGHLIKTNFIDNIEPDLLRVMPCGHDQRGNNFYYFFGTRLYKESNVKHDPLTGTGTFDWDLVAADPDAFQTVLAGLKKLGLTTRSKALINHLEHVILPGLPGQFEEKNQVDLQRRLDHRRRRSAALQQAKERAKLERQEAAALRSSAKRAARVDEERDGGEWSECSKRQSTAASRAERYQRRTRLLGAEEPCSGAGQLREHRERNRQEQRGTSACRRKKYEQAAAATRAPETKADLMEKADRLLWEWLTRQAVQWPLLNST